MPCFSITQINGIHRKRSATTECFNGSFSVFLPVFPLSFSHSLSLSLGIRVCVYIFPQPVFPFIYLSIASALTKYSDIADCDSDVYSIDYILRIPLFLLLYIYIGRVFVCMWMQIVKRPNEMYKQMAERGTKKIYSRFFMWIAPFLTVVVNV